MRLLVFIFIISLFLPLHAQAAKELTIDLAHDQVDITTGFAGETLVLFGTYKPGSDVVVVLEGPRKDMAVRQKNNTLGMWMNTKHHVFEDVPVFYDYARGSERNHEYIIPSSVKERHGITADYFAPSPGKVKKEDEFKLFKDAFIRNQRDAGMYPAKPQNITFLSDRLFKTSMYVPSDVPQGEYTIRTFMLNGETLLETAQTRLKVAQVGRGAQINHFANHYGFLYGLLCILFALSAGWGINVIRRKT